MTGAIVLAAGAGSRMGRQKMLLPFSGRAVVAHVVEQLKQGGIVEGTVVTGADADDVARAVADCGFTIARNPDYTRGMLSSVRAGLMAAPDAWTAALIALGDQPLITSEIVRAVLLAGADPQNLIVVPTSEGRRGHPMLLPRIYWKEILTQHDDVGLRGVLRAHADQIREVEVDSEDILCDVDTPEDYARALRRAAELQSRPIDR